MKKLLMPESTLMDIVEGITLNLRETFYDRIQK